MCRRRRGETRYVSVRGVQTCALPISDAGKDNAVSLLQLPHVDEKTAGLLAKKGGFDRSGIWRRCLGHTNAPKRS